MRGSAVRLGIAAGVLLLAPAAPGAGEERGAAIVRPHYRVAKATGPIAIDGRLDDAAWDDALAIELSYEMFPGNNTPPAVRTEMRVTFDDDRLYAAFHAEDPAPPAIRARFADRDDVVQEDFVGILVDPFNDGRRGFEFFVNPLGVQMDALLDDVSRTEDFSWDAIWYAAGRLTAEGYAVEIAVPFSSLSFPRAAGEQTWGVDGQRIYPRGQRYRFRTQEFDRDLACSVCQISKMTGIAGVSPGRNLELDPTLTSSRTDARESLGDPGLEAGDVEAEAGLTATWGVTPNVNLAATLNPDFSQVEADIPQLEINTRFALFFPETRPFFNEEADLFNSPFNVVHTRVLADPDWGLRTTGKQGRHAFGFFSVRDALTRLELPGAQASASVQVGDENQATVLRYRTDFGRSSSFGVVATDREGEGGYANRVAGLDGVFHLTASDVVQFQLLSSETRYSAAIRDADPGLPAGAFRDDAARIAYTHRSLLWNAYAAYEDVGEGFRADLGFVPRVGYRFVQAGLERLWWGGDASWWRRWRAGGEWALTEDPGGIELEKGYEAWSEVLGPRQSTLELGYQRRRRFFSGVFFEESLRRLTFSIRPSGNLFVALFAQSGDEIDVANVRGGDELRLEPRIEVNTGRHLRVELRHTFRALDVDGGELFSARLTDLRLIYQINLRCFVRLITQLSDIERDPELYTRPVRAKEQDLLDQLLFSYKLNPRTVLFVGYADQYEADDDFALSQRSRSVFLKLGYAWLP